MRNTVIAILCCLLLGGCASRSVSVSPLPGISAAQPAFRLHDPGTEQVVDYERYGEFVGSGTSEYRYILRDRKGLARAQGAGIFPSRSVGKEPLYTQLQQEGRIEGSVWQYVGSDDPVADFFVWATVQDIDSGVKLYFTGVALQNAGLYPQALKAFRTAMLLFPQSACWNKEQTWQWYIAPAAWSAILNLTRLRPELELSLVGAHVEVEAERYDAHDAAPGIALTPGEFVRFSFAQWQQTRVPQEQVPVILRRGGRVAVVQYEDGRWGFEINGTPTLVRGVTYSPTKVGHNYEWDWMSADENNNGINDVAYETWVDANRNMIQDADEPTVGDFALLRDMGANAIRLMNYHPFNKELLRDLKERFGVGVFICEPLGAYTLHSGAGWYEGTDYSDPQQRRRMTDAVREMVLNYRDEPWLLGYILGNENNMAADYTGVNATRTQARLQPRVYAEFLQEMAELIKELDPEHPVGVGNIGLDLVDAYARYAPALDFIGVNAYLGADGFGSLWQKARRLFDRPVLITEFGCDAYATGKGVDEAAQETYHRQNWEDIVHNSASGPGEGNSIGGIVFSWVDEWWKDTGGDPWDHQHTEPTCEMAFPDGWSQEEWLGIISQGDGSQSPFLRQPRQAYYMYQTRWNPPEEP